MSLETLNSISENLNLSDVSGSFLNIQKFISKNKSKDSDYFDVNLQSSLNEQQSSAIKSNMSLEENRELVETITVDDEFGEILDSEDEFETAKETSVDEYKNTNSIEIETKLDELSSTIENNNLNLVKNINSSELNLENAKENWKETLNLIDKNKSNTINLKKDLLDNYTSDTLNNNYGSIESKQLSDIVNEKLNSINSIKENSENNIETLSSKYLDNLNNRKNKNNELISSKFEVLENYSTNVNNKTDEIEPVKGYNHSKFDIEVKTGNKEDEIKENDSKIIDSLKFKNSIKNDVKDTPVKKDDLETLKKHYSKSNHYVLNNEDANKIYNLLKNNKILNVETITVDDEFGEILDSEDEFETAKETSVDEYKNTNSIEIETKLDELSSTIENNNLNLVKNINSSELNLENAKENWKETLNLIDKNKSNTINLKKDLLDNYTSDTLNNNYGSIESKQLSDIVNEKLNSINSIKENSENNIETLSSKYLDNLNNRKNKNNELISSKFEVLENYSTNVNNKTDEIEPVKGYNHSKFDIEVKTGNKEDEIKENDSKIIDSLKFKNSIKNDVKDTPVKKDDLETLKKHYSKSNHYVLNNEDANKIYNLLKNNKILNVETYNYLNSYADIKKIDIKDIVREYKSKKENDLDDFIYDLIKSTLKIESNTVVNSPINATQKLTLDQQGYKIKNDVTSFEVKNNKIIPIVKNDQKITNDDINDLFS